MDNGEEPKIVGICTEIVAKNGQECGGAIIQDIIEKKRGKILGFFLGHTELVWRCEKCKEVYSITNPIDTIRSLSR